MYVKIQHTVSILAFMHFVRHQTGKGKFDEMREALWILIDMANCDDKITNNN